MGKKQDTTYIINGYTVNLKYGDKKLLDSMKNIIKLTLK